MRIAFVSGGTRGIGRAIAERLHARGYRVIASGTRPERPVDLPKEIDYIGCNIGESEQRKAAFRYIEETYGCCCMCSFWDMVVERIMEAEEGETVEILEAVPCHRMPEKVMQALRERSDVTLVLNLQDGTQLIIEAGTALEAPVEPGHHCYAISWLVEHYMGVKV